MQKNNSIRNISIHTKWQSLIQQAKDMKKSFQTGAVFCVAFALKGGVILNVGINDYNKMHPRKSLGAFKHFKNDPKLFKTFEYSMSLHAEADLIKKLGPFREDYHKITIVVIRINNNGNIALAAPCLNCTALLSKYKFKRILFTLNSNEELGELKL